MSGIIRATLDVVAQTFRLNKLESPIHDAAGRLDPISGSADEEVCRRRSRSDTPASRPTGSNPQGAILDEKRDGRRDRPTRGRRILFRNAVVRVLRRGQRKAVNIGQNGRRLFPEERRDTDDNGPRSLARRRHRHYHVQETEERRQRSDGDATSKRQLEDSRTSVPFKPWQTWQREYETTNAKDRRT